MEIRQLNTFAAIAKTGSFTQAAEILGYAQSSVTAQIQSLENELNTKLFERIGKSVTLTTDGTQLLYYAQKILMLSEEAKNVLCNSGVPKGILKVGTVESLCVMRLPGIFKEFRARYPDAELTVKLDPCTEFKRMLKENIIDVVIQIGNGAQEDDFIVALQFPEPMALIVAPCHPFAAKESISPKDIADQSLILTEHGCSYRSAFEKMLVDAGAKPRSVLETGSIQAIKQLTADGLGISLLPRIAAENEIKQGSLKCLEWAGPDFCMKTEVLYHKDKWISPVLRVFLDLLQTIRPKEI